MSRKKVTRVEVRAFSPKVDFFFNILIALFAISCLVPFIFVIIISLTSEVSLASMVIVSFHKNGHLQLMNIFLQVKCLKKYSELSE